MEGRPAISSTLTFVFLSSHLIPRMKRMFLMWNIWRLDRFPYQMLSPVNWNRNTIGKTSKKEKGKKCFISMKERGNKCFIRCTRILQSKTWTENWPSPLYNKYFLNDVNLHIPNLLQPKNKVALFWIWVNLKYSHNPNKLTGLNQFTCRDKKPNTLISLLILISSLKLFTLLLCKRCSKVGVLWC